MERESRRNLSVLLPWILLFGVLGAFTIIGYGSRESSTPSVDTSKKLDLLSTMRIQLLEAIEAEKNAVLAITDAASEEFAARARRAVAGAEASHKELQTIIDPDETSTEAKGMKELSACWSQFKTLDEAILDLATQNTNLKAQRLSATRCAHEMQLFEMHLQRIIQHGSIPRPCSRSVVLSYEALTAGLTLFTLHKPHIEEPDDQEMDRIEQRMRSHETAVGAALAGLRDLPDLRGNQDLKNAEASFEQFMALTNEVLSLSRKNTNIKSSELSLGKKRLVSSQCQEILAALEGAVKTQRFRATR